MSFDGVFMHHIIDELKQTLIEGRITKIYQLSDFSFLFTIRGKQKHQLLISPSKQNTRMHLTKATYQKPMQPPLFCMILRKHIEGARIDAITQQGNDRIAFFELSSKDELGDFVKKTLIFEAVGKDANLVLTDHNNIIIDCLNHTHPFEDKRTMIPGARYEPLTDTRTNPFDNTKAKDIFQTHVLDSPTSLMHAFEGIGPTLAKIWFNRQERSDFQSLNTIIHDQTFQYSKEKHTIFANTALSHIDGKTVTFDNANTMLDQLFINMEDKNKTEQLYKTLEKNIKQHIKKHTHKIEKLSQSLDKNKHAKDNRIKGDLLLANQHQIKRGSRHIEAFDYEQNKPVMIPLDPTLTVVENANRYFKAYKKQKKSIPHIKQQIIRSKNERTYFTMLEDQIKHADLSDLEEIKLELQQYGYLKQRQKPSKKLSKKAKHLTFTDEDGITILVGKNNTQNAEITHKIAAYNHVWFHVQGFAGSHVVAQTTLDSISETTIRTAAQLAAYYSKMRHSSSVPVDYTEVRHIKKIPGQKPCFVTFTHQKTIYIDPDETFIKTLKHQ